MIKIVSANKWGLENGYYSKQTGWTLGYMPETFNCRKGQKEYVILDSPKDIEKELKALPNDSFLFQKLSVITKYLTAKNIKFEIHE